MAEFTKFHRVNRLLVQGRSPSGRSLVPRAAAPKARIGHVLVLADWDGDTARATALGHVVGSIGENLDVDWRPTTFSMHPSGGGKGKWNTKETFEFAADPAASYRLADRAQALFGSGASPAMAPPTLAAAPAAADATAAPAAPAASEPSAPRPHLPGVTRAASGARPVRAWNRVTPTGTIEPLGGRGPFMGNRGCLHDDAGNLVRSSAVKRWLICDPNGRGTIHPIGAPGQYTHLFFLDEATALAAGHRPCNRCRGDALTSFQQAWQRAHLGPSTTESIDQRLASERHAPGHPKTWRAELGDLPDGTMVLTASDGPALWWHGRFRVWSMSGYGPPTSAHGTADVLTPPATVAVLNAGYRPVVHPSATAT